MEQFNNKYLVSVRCFTYNQSKFITETLNGFTIQQTSFPFIILIVDDSSTDGEQDVIRNYIHSHFDMDSSESYENDREYANIIYSRHKSNRNCYIAALLLKQNMYKKPYQKFEYLSEWRDICKYEALCEGDDYWIHPLKLQKQVDIMEANNKIGLVYAKIKNYHEKSKKFKGTFGGTASNFKELIKSNCIPTLTVMYRLEAIKDYTCFTNNIIWPMGDYPIWLYISLSWKISFIDEVFGVYRILEESISHSNDYNHNKKFLEGTLSIRRFFCQKYEMNDINLNNLLDYSYGRLFRLAYLEKEYNDANNYYKEIKKPTIKQRIRHFIILTTKKTNHNI